MSMVSVSTRGHLGIPLLYDMAGSQLSAPVSVQHALSCTKGGFPTFRHNEVKDLRASLLTEVCSNVSVEPGLQQLSGEELSRASANVDEGAQMDVAADSFWGRRRKRAFFHIRVFTPHAPSNRQSSLSATY